MACFILRFRAARGVERQQFKWLAYATAVLVAGLSAGSVLSALGVPDAISSYFNVVPLFGLPIAVGFAILHHRLYDIDRLRRLRHEQQRPGQLRPEPRGCSRR